MNIPFLGMFFGNLNIFEILLILIMMSVGILFGIYFSIVFRAKNRIFYLREKDGRGQDLKIDRESPISLETRSDPPLRFFKWGRAYEFLGRLGRKFTTFFGKEGTAYTWVLQGFHMVPHGPVVFQEITYWDQDDHEILVYDEFQEEEPQKYELEFPSLATAVMYRWGTRFWNTVPAERKAELENEKVLVTVELEPGLTPEGYKAITEKDIDDAGDENILKLWAKSAKAALGANPTDTLMTMMAGGLLVLVAAFLLGWIQLAGEVTAVARILGGM